MIAGRAVSFARAARPAHVNDLALTLLLVDLERYERLLNAYEQLVDDVDCWIWEQELAT